MNILYCHGFASSPGSRKASAFQQFFASKGISVDIPALDGGDFEHLTISGQLQIVEERLAGEPCTLIGSSMGGYLAALYASRHPEVERLVLLAPAFDFAPRWRDKLEPGKPFDVYHYGEKRSRTVHYRLIEDALTFPPIPHFTQPSLIFHGKNDDVVPIGLSRAFAASHANVTLCELDSDHELTDMLDTMLRESSRFLMLAE